MWPPPCFTIPYTVDRPSPVPFPFSLVVKNGSKIAALDAVVDAVAGVAHGQHHVGARRTVERRSRASSSPIIDVRGLHDQLAAARHGVARVHRQIQNHLLDLPRIGPHHAQVRARSP